MYTNQYAQTTLPNPAVQIRLDYLKSFFKRPVILALAIVMTVSVLVTLASNILFALSSDSLLNALNEFSTTSGADLSSSGSFVMNLSESIIGVAINSIFVAAFFIIYFKSKNPSPTSTPASGFTIVYVYTLLSLIFTCIGIFFCFIAFGLFFTIFSSLAISSSSNADAVSVLNIIMIAVLFVVLLSIALTLVWIISCFRFVSAVRKGLNPNIPLSAKGATPAGVFSIIFAVCSFLSIISLISIPMILSALTSSGELTTTQSIALSKFLSTFTPVLILFSVPVLLSAIQYILYAVIAFGYKKHVNAPDAPAFMPVPAPMSAPMPAYVPNNQFSNTYGNNTYGNTSYGNNTNGNPYNTNIGSTYGADNEQQPADPQSTEPDGPVVTPWDVPVNDTAPETICSNCGTPYTQGDTFCQQCGQKLD
ncbi:MAG TPA: hypothetical protein GX401_08810 [Clostridiales bacterium]|nr:hypothetical protein [Clostridiales bacterium]